MKSPLAFSFERRSKARFIYRLTNRVSCLWALMAALLILSMGGDTTPKSAGASTNLEQSSANYQFSPTGAANQTITFPVIPNKTFGVDGPFNLTATASSGLPVSYTVFSGPATVSGSLVTLTGAGTVSIRASQAGNNTFAPALPVSQTFTVFAAGASSTAFLKQIGATGAPNGDFYLPYGVAVDSNQNLYVVDTGNQRIQVFDATGNFKFTFGRSGSGNGRFSLPRGIAVDSSQNIYVTDTSNNRIQVFDSAGNFKFKFGSNGAGNGQFSSAQGIAVDSSQNIYVADGGNHRIQVFDSAGNFKFRFGNSGAGNGQFNFPRGVAVDSSQNIYVADAGNHRIQVFDSAGNFKFKFGSFGSGNGQFNSPSGIAVDSSKNIYVVDTGNNRIQVFDSAGNFNFLSGSAGPGNGQFTLPQGIAVDNSQSIYVADTSNNRIQVFDAAGAFARIAASFGIDVGNIISPQAVAVDGAGNIYVADANNNRVQVFDSAGNFKFAFGSAGNGNGQFASPEGIAADSQNIYVADTFNNRIQVFDSAGNFKFNFGSNGTGNGQFSFPAGIGVDSSQNIYVVDSGNNRIQVFDSAGNFKFTFGSNGSGNGQFSSPRGLAVDSSKNVYVADSANNRIQVFDSAGTFKFTFGSTGTGNSQFFFPSGVAVDSSQNIYVADTDNQRIQIFDSAGNFKLKFGSFGTASNTQFFSPQGVAIDTSSNILIADTGNNRILKFSHVFPTSLLVAAASGPFGGTTTLMATLSSPDGATFSPKLVSFALNGNNVGTANTDGNGVATLNNVSLAGINAGNYNNGVSASVAADYFFAASAGSNKLTVTGTNQTVTFPAIPNKTFGVDGPFNLTATASSGLPVSYTVFSGPATINGSMVTLTGAGTVSIRASQAGNNTFAPAPPVSQTFTVFAQGASQTAFLKQIGATAFPNGDFFLPYAVAVDSNKNLYVADSGNNRIQVFDSAGNFKFTFGRSGPGNGQFFSPVSIAVDNSQNIYVIDSGNNRVQVFDSAGNFKFKFGSNGTGNGQFSFPAGIGVDSSQNIYVVDSGNNRIQVFDSAGNFKFTFGSNGSGNGQFSSPRGLAVDSSKNVYVADSDNNRIQVFDSAGTFKFKFGNFGAGNGQFNFPFGIALDSSQNIYVVDEGNNRIEVFDSAGNFKFAFGSAGNGNGQFASPLGIAVDSSQNIYVADINNNRIEVFDAAGTFARIFASFGSDIGNFIVPEGVAVDGPGNIYVADSFNNRIQVFDSAGNSKFAFGSYGFGNGQFNFPEGIAVDSSQNIYVADTFNERVQVFDSAGNFKFKFGSSGTGNSEFNIPSGIAVDSSQNIYIADSNNHRIEVFDSAGNFKFKFGSNGSGSGQFNYPFGVAVDSSQNIYVADYNDSRIQVFDSAGSFKFAFGSNGSDNGQLSAPSGITLDGNRNIYVADTGNSRIQVFDSAGNFKFKFGSFGSGNTQFGTPTGIALDSSRNIYTVDTFYSRLQKFAHIFPTSLLVAPATGAVGGTITLTATLSSPDGATFSPKPVSFSLNGNNVGTANTDANGVATLSNVSLAGISRGTYNSGVSASFAADDFLAASTGSNTLTVTAAATTTTVASSANPSDFGQIVTFTAIVTSASGTPTGSVLFRDGATTLATANCVAGTGNTCTAQFTTSILTVGTHQITAAFTDSTLNFASSNGTLAGGQVVRARPTLSVNDVSITEGDTGAKTLTFTVTLSAASNLTVTANFATADVTATAPSDYLAANGTLTFNPGDLTKTIGVTINGDTSFEPNESFAMNLSNPFNATIRVQGTGTILNDDVEGGFISLSQANYSVSESTGFLTIAVNRTNDTSRAATVDYATDATGAPASCATVNGLASSRCDFTTAVGTLKFAAGETQKTFTVLVNGDSYTEGPELFAINLSNPTGGAVLIAPSSAMVTITDGPAGPPANLIDDARFFVRQHYHDFLNREPDQGGWDFWTNNINNCTPQPSCREIQRINTSAAYFLSIEFQQTGYLVERIYKAAYGDANGASTLGGAHQLAVPIVRFIEFLPDTQRIGQGVIVGQTGWETVLENNKVAFVAEFVQRSRFSSALPVSMTPAQFVDRLFLNAGVTPSATDRNAAIAEFGASTNTSDIAARARALRDVAENSTLNTQEFNRAFVLMQFFGYLRRDPNTGPDTDYTGYDFWLTKLNQFNGNYVSAEMVKAFITSLEYRQRFGP